MQTAIQARGLTRSFGDTTALDGFDLDVGEGTVVALLGPNGAGKTTAVSILATLDHCDSGTATVAGFDVSTNAADVRRQIGLSGQYAAVDEYLTGFENLAMIGKLYHLGRRAARARADELLEQFGLTDAAHRPTRTYSGGMRRRLDLAGAIVAEPAVVFLDEPTTGLDPRSRLGLWSAVRDLVQSGTTVLLTTQYLEEADELADNIVVIADGREIAQGSPDELKQAVGDHSVSLTVPSADDIARAVELLSVVDRSVHARGTSIVLPTKAGTHTLKAAVDQLEAHGIGVNEASLLRPTLDDVFLALTDRPSNATKVAA